MPYSTKCTTPLSNFEANQNYKDVVDPAGIAIKQCYKFEQHFAKATEKVVWSKVLLDQVSNPQKRKLYIINQYIQLPLDKWYVKWFKNLATIWYLNINKIFVNNDFYQCLSLFQSF